MKRIEISCLLTLCLLAGVDRLQEREPLPEEASAFSGSDVVRIVVDNSRVHQTM